MQLSDPLLVVIGVVLLIAVGGAILRLTGRLLRSLGSVVGVVVVLWVASKLLGFDLPYLP